MRSHRRALTQTIGESCEPFPNSWFSFSERNPAGERLFEIDGEDVTSLTRKEILVKLALCSQIELCSESELGDGNESEKSPDCDGQSDVETEPPILQPPAEPNVTLPVEDEMPQMRRQQSLRELRQVEGVEALQRLKSYDPPSGRKSTFLCKGMCGTWVEKDKHEYIKEGQSVLCAACAKKSHDSEEKIICGKCQQEFAYSKFLVDLGVRAQPSVCEECQEESQWTIISPCPWALCDGSCVGAWLNTWSGPRVPGQGQVAHLLSLFTFSSVWKMWIWVWGQSLCRIVVFAVDTRHKFPAMTQLLSMTQVHMSPPILDRFRSER